MTGARRRGQRSGTLARADIVARGVFATQVNTYFDVTVIDTGSNSRELLGRRDSSLGALQEAERRKRAEYEERVLMLGTFTPLACSIYGTLAPEAEQCLGKVVSKLRTERKSREDTSFVHRICLQLAVIRATSLCLRGRSLTTLPNCDVQESWEEEAEDGLGVAMEDCRVAISDGKLAMECGREGGW